MQKKSHLWEGYFSWSPWPQAKQNILLAPMEYGKKMCSLKKSSVPQPKNLDTPLDKDKFVYMVIR